MRTLPTLLLSPMMAALVLIASLATPANTSVAAEDDRVKRAVDRGLEYLVRTQGRNGRWEANGGTYPVAMTALAGMALLMDGNTTLEGRYAPNVQAAVGFLLDQVQPNGLIGDPRRDSRYLYGHGFSMLFLSQVLGEEEDIARRQQLVQVLTKAVIFCGQAQTDDGGWGYVSARDGRGFDEGSVTITQMQGLRGCRNAGIPVPRDIVDKGIKYIEKCTDENGGVRYSLKTSGGPRPPITAAAVACMFSAGEYDDPAIQKLIKFSDEHLFPGTRDDSYGHWHYAQYYYSQVRYSQGEEKWNTYRNKIIQELLSGSGNGRQGPDGSWDGMQVGPVYTTSLALTILQLENAMLPIYQR